MANLVAIKDKWIIRIDNAAPECFALVDLTNSFIREFGHSDMKRMIVAERYCYKIPELIDRLGRRIDDLIGKVSSIQSHEWLSRAKILLQSLEIDYRNLHNNTF